MTVYLTCRSIGASWLADGGSTRRSVADAEQLLLAIGEADAATAPEAAEQHTVISIDPIVDGWLAMLRGREYLVRKGNVEDAALLWSMITEPTISVGSIGTAIQRFAFGGAPDEELRTEILGEEIVVTRAQARLLHRAGGMLVQLGRAVSISQETRDRRAGRLRGSTG